MDLFKRLSGRLSGKKRRKKRRQKKTTVRQKRVRQLWLLLGVAAVAVVAGIGLLNWSRTGRGQAVLLTLGSDRMYGEVQAAVDSVLALVLTDLVAGPTQDPEDTDWPLPALGKGALVRCRSVAVPAGESWWTWQQRIADAVSPVGARILWGERLLPERLRPSQTQPNESKDLLRLDVGVKGRPTHTLVLHRRGVRPGLHWGRVPAVSRWTSLVAGDGPVVALIIDDWGHNQSAAALNILDLPVPVTLAVLPALPYSRHFALQRTDLILPPGMAAIASVDESAINQRQARLRTGCLVEVTTGPLRHARRQRREIMLHMPMEPSGYPEQNPGHNPVLVGMGPAAVNNCLVNALGSLANVTGVNNHMGSAATSDTPTMKAFMSALKRQRLFFVDSQTTSRSVAFAEAVASGIPATRNRIFLDDNTDDESFVAAHLDRLVQAASATGFAVGIGHPHRATAAVLARRIPALVAEGVRFVTVSELMALQSFRADVAAGIGE